MVLDKIFTAKAIAIYWNKLLAEQNSAPYFGESIFPAKKKTGLDLKFIKGKSGLPVSLKPSAFDAQAELRDRIGVTAIQTEMPFFREGFKIDERDRQEILRVQDSKDPYAQVVLGNIYNDAKNLIDGALVVPERMRMQLLSPADGSPKILISSGNVSYEYNYDTDGSFAKNNFKALTGKNAWTDYDNSDPISDIEDAQDYIEETTGERPTVLLLNKKTMKDLVNNKKLQSYCLAKAAANGGVVRMTTALVKDYLREELSLEAVVYNKMFNDESGKAQKFYPDNMATLLPSSPLGNTYFGTTPEEADLASTEGANVAVVNTGVAVTVITKNEIPVNTATYASEITLPSFEGMDKVFVISTATAEG
jgi:hypothetical protein